MDAHPHLSKLQISKEDLGRQQEVGLQPVIVKHIFVQEQLLMGLGMMFYAQNSK